MVRSIALIKEGIMTNETLYMVYMAILVTILLGATIYLYRM